MSKKISIQLVQLNNRYGNQVYMPYSVGVLETFVKQKEIIREKTEINIAGNNVDIEKKSTYLELVSDPICFLLLSLIIFNILDITRKKKTETKSISIKSNVWRFDSFNSMKPWLMNVKKVKIHKVIQAMETPIIHFKSFNALTADIMVFTVSFNFKSIKIILFFKDEINFLPFLELINSKPNL